MKQKRKAGNTKRWLASIFGGSQGRKLEAEARILDRKQDARRGIKIVNEKQNIARKRAIEDTEKQDCHWCNYRVTTPCKSVGDTKNCENY